MEPERLIDRHKKMAPALSVKLVALPSVKFTYNGFPFVCFWSFRHQLGTKTLLSGSPAKARDGIDEDFIVCGPFPFLGVWGRESDP